MGQKIYKNIEIRGVVYADARAAAVALGVTPDNVRMCIRNGTLHRCGTGGSHPEPLPVRIRGRVYPSARAAALALKVRANTIYKALGEGDVDRVGVKRPHPRNRAKPVTIGGLTFPSMRAASLELGFQGEYVSRVLRKRTRRGLEELTAAAMRLSAKRDAERGRAA